MLLVNGTNFFHISYAIEMILLHTGGINSQDTFSNLVIQQTHHRVTSLCFACSALTCKGSNSWRLVVHALQSYALMNTAW